MSIVMTPCKPQPLNLKNYPMPATLDSIAEQLHDIRQLLTAPRPKPQPIKRRSRRDRPFSKSQHETLEVFEANGRNVQVAAEAVGITRQSMEGRLSRLRIKLKTTGATFILNRLKPYRAPRKKLQALPTDLRGNIAI